MKKVSKMILGLCSSLLLLVGCNRALSEEEERAFMDSFMKKITESKDVLEVETEMAKHIDRVSKDNQSHLVDGYIFALHQEAKRMEEKMQGMKSTLEECRNKKEIKGHIITDEAKKIKDPTLSAFLNEVEEKHLIVVRNERDYVVYPNMDYVYERYRKFMKEDLKDLVLFVGKEYTSAPVIDEDGVVDLDETAKRIVEIEKLMNKHKNSPHYRSYAQVLHYYYETYFGLNNEDVLKDNVVQTKAYKHYREVIFHEKYKGTQFRKDVETYVNKLDKTDRYVNDELYEFLFSMVDGKLKNNDKEEKKQDTEEKDQK